MTILCAVCGADATDSPDGATCPVCGADLPVGQAEGETVGEVADVGGTPPDAGSPVSPVPPPPPPPSAWPTAAPAARPSAHDPSHPSGLSQSARTWAMLTHLSAFAGALVALAFVGPLVMWLIRREEHPFLDHHGKEALNFNLSLLLYGVIGIVASVATLGLGLVVVIPAIVVFFVLWVVLTIQAAVKANNGEGYRYPLTIRFIAD